MKTLLLELNRTLLVVELTEEQKHGFSEAKIIQAVIYSQEYIQAKLGNPIKLEFLCKGGELIEEKIIENEIILKGRNSYGELVYENHYPEIGAFMGLNAALDSFRSKIESLGWYWLENHECSDVTCSEAGDYVHWSSVKSSTFNPECLIFIKK